MSELPTFFYFSSGVIIGSLFVIAIRLDQIMDVLKKGKR